MLSREAGLDGLGTNLQELVDDPEVSISPRLRVVDPPHTAPPTQACLPVLQPEV